MRDALVADFARGSVGSWSFMDAMVMSVERHFLWTLERGYRDARLFLWRPNFTSQVSVR